MVELSQRHLSPNIFAHGNKRDGKDSERLECIITSLFLGFVLFLVFIVVLVLGIFLLLLFLFLLVFVLVLVLITGGIDVLIAVMKHCLYLQHVPGSSVRASFNHDLCCLCDRMINGLQGLDRGIGCVL